MYTNAVLNSVMLPLHLRQHLYNTIFKIKYELYIYILIVNIPPPGTNKKFWVCAWPRSIVGVVHFLVYFRSNTKTNFGFRDTNGRSMKRTLILLNLGLTSFLYNA